MRRQSKPLQTEGVVKTVRLFRSKGYLAFKLPKGFRVHVKELEVFRNGAEIILRPKRATSLRKSK